MPTDATAPDADPMEVLVLAGRAAERSGALGEAIALFTAANRLERRADLERRLMELRRDAAAMGAPADSPALWPPPVDDPFSEVVGLPEIGPDELDARTLGGGILHHGALVVRGFADEAEAAALREAVDATIAGRDDPDRWPGWYEPLDVPGDDDLAVGRALTAGLGGGLLAVDAPHAFFLLAELVHGSGFTDAVRDHLGRAPVLTANKTTFRRLREAPDTAWHQDGSFMGPVRAVNLWISLSHCGGATDTRGLDVIPARMDRLLETGTEGAGADVAAIGAALVERVVPTPMVSPEFRPGDALCFDDRFLHRTSAAPVTGVRHAVEAWFFAPAHVPAGYSPVVI